MSLGKLLATGRSLVGGAPDEGRYNISRRNRLPKFGSAKNPFAPSATAEPRPAIGSAPNDSQAELAMPVARPSAEVVAERIAAFVAASESVCAPEASVAVSQPVRADRTQRIPKLADQPLGPVAALPASRTSFASRRIEIIRVVDGALKGGWEVAIRFVRGLKWRSGLAASRSFVIGLWPKAKAVCVKLAGVFRKSEPAQVFPRLGKPAVQAELSLDTVKVVRNSLEDSDLEIVAAPTATSTLVAPTTPAAVSKRGPVPPALKKMTERLLGVPAVD